MPHPGFASGFALKRFHTLQPHLEDGVSLAVISREGSVSVRTLRRWRDLYNDEGISGLERKGRSDQGKRRKISPELETMVKQLVSKRKRPPLTALHRQICGRAADLDLPFPSYGIIADIARTLSLPAKTLASGNLAKYRDTHELVHRREAACANEVWQADHTLLDIMLLDSKGNPARPWLSIIVDDYSRAIAGYFLTFNAPSAMNTALALHQAIWRKEDPRWIICGIPEILYVDNGSDFTSEHIGQACVALKMQLVHSFPGRPRGRGRVERLFRTINDMFLADHPGHIIAGKPVTKAKLEIEVFAQLFEDFLHGTYHLRCHGGTGEPPLQRWQNGGFLPNLPETRQSLDMLLLRVNRLRRVSRDGIRFKGMRYTEPTLAAFVGEYIELLYDPRDLAEIYVYHENAFICRALSTGHPEAPELADIQKARNAVRRLHRDEVKPPKNPDQSGRKTGLKLYASDD